MTGDGSTLRRVKDVLWILVLLGGAAILLRMFDGLGASTALSDSVPWGFWKILNMVAGVALGTGGFAIAFAGHVLRIEKLRPIVRPAILVALMGYASSCFALFLDIGRPFRIWHVFIHWNVHSFLFEVAWCVMLYLTVTVLEFAPIALEGSRFRKLHDLLKKIALPVVIAGITFSTLHHTSLGSLFLVAPYRLHTLWATPWLPVHFILSAIGSGLMFIVLGVLLVARLYRREPPIEVLRSVAVAGAAILSIYLVTRFVDLAGRGVLGVLFSGQWEGNLLLLELLLAVAIPVVLVAMPKTRRSTSGLATAAICAVAGLILNRLDVGIFGFWRSGATTYFPSLPELAITLGIPAAAGLVFFALVERFRVFEMGPALRPEEPVSCTRFEKLTGVWSHVRIDNVERWSLMAVFVIPVAVILYGPGASAEEEIASVRPPLAVDATRSVLRIDANRDGAGVVFAHVEHQQRLGGETSCATCHHLNLPGDQATSCHVCHRGVNSAVSVFDHSDHQAWVATRDGFDGASAANRTCAVCHPSGKPREGATASACGSCHGENMAMEAGARLGRAPSYPDALHGSCANCHRERASEVGRPHLGECQTCHD